MKNGAIARIWWFQDDAPAHRSHAIHERLAHLFPNHVVGLGHQVEWPPRSPDLSPCDFFLWGYLKNRIYRTRVANIPELKQKITNEVNALRRAQIIRRVFRSMEDRIAKCIARGGGHFERR